MLRILTHENIKGLNIDPALILSAIKEALILHSKGKVLLKPKVTLRPTEDTFYTAMAGGIPDMGFLGNKTIQRISSSKNGPSVRGAMMLHDAVSGDLLSLMDATWLTSMRTGAVAALTIDQLANKEITKIGILGLGNTGKATLEFIKLLRPEIQRVYAVNYKDHAEFITKRFPDFSFIFVDDPKALLENCDVVITSLTYAKEPFVEPEWMRDGLLAVPIHMRGWQKCDKFFDKVFTDDHEHIRDWMPKVDGELGQILSGQLAGREDERQKIIAYNYGIAIDDIAIGKVVLESAIKQGVGTLVDFEKFASKDVL